MASVLCSFNAFAQYGNNLEQDAAQLAQEINANGRYLAPAQRAEISREFGKIRSVLYGQAAPRTEFACVSRDNDGRDPYALGVRSGVNVTRIKDAIFTNAPACEASIQGARNTPVSSLFCVSRDNDGQAPWVVGSLAGNGVVTKVRQSATKSQQECQALLNRFQTRSVQTTFCGSRDSDGQAPYVALSYNFSSGQVTGGSESFQDINQCWSFLGQR